MVLVVILLSILCILAIPLIPTCKQQQQQQQQPQQQEYTSKQHTDIQQHCQSAYMIELDHHRPSPSLLPEPELFTSDPCSASVNQKRPNSVNMKANILHSQYDKCTRGLASRKIQIVPQGYNHSQNRVSNSWNFGK